MEFTCSFLEVMKQTGVLLFKIFRRTVFYLCFEVYADTLVMQKPCFEWPDNYFKIFGVIAFLAYGFV